MTPKSTATSTPGDVTDGGVRLLRELASVPLGAFAISPAGHHLVVVDEEIIGVKAFDISTQDVIWQFEVPENDLTTSPNWLHTVAFSPSGELVATGGETKTVYLLDALSGQLKERREPIDRVWQLAFSPNGSFVFTGSIDEGTPLISWNVQTSETREYPYTGRAFAIAPDSTQIAVTSEGYSPGLRIVNITTGDEVILWSDPVYVDSIAFSVDGRLVAAGIDGQLHIWNIADSPTEEPALPWETYYDTKSAISQIVFSARGHLGVVNSNHEASIWDTSKKTLIGILPVEVYQIAFTQDGSQLVASGNPMTVWEVP